MVSSPRDGEGAARAAAKGGQEMITAVLAAGAATGTTSLVKHAHAARTYRAIYTVIPVRIAHTVL